MLPSFPSSWFALRSYPSVAQRQLVPQHCALYRMSKCLLRAVCTAQIGNLIWKQELDGSANVSWKSVVKCGHHVFSHCVWGWNEGNIWQALSCLKVNTKLHYHLSRDVGAWWWRKRNFFDLQLCYLVAANCLTGAAGDALIRLPPISSMGWFNSSILTQNGMWVVCGHMEACDSPVLTPSNRTLPWTRFSIQNLPEHQASSWH